MLLLASGFLNWPRWTLPAIQRGLAPFSANTPSMYSYALEGQGGLTFLVLGLRRLSPPPTLIKFPVSSECWDERKD